MPTPTNEQENKRKKKYKLTGSGINKVIKFIPSHAQSPIQINSQI